MTAGTEPMTAPGSPSREPIRRMLDPGSIAVVGASDRMGYGGRVLANLLHGGYAGTIYPVNPRASEIQGLPAFPSVTAIPGPVDLAVIVVPAAAIPGVVEDCGRKGVPAAAIITAGFAEQDAEGRARQDEIVAIARRYGVRLSGPNCLGIANLPGRVFAAATAAATWTAAAHDVLAGRISVVSQSGALAFSPILARSQERGVGLRYLVSVGNQCDLTLTDFVDYLVEDDPGTEVVAVFMEGLPPGEGRRFLAVARRAAEVGKPLLVLKVARSSASAAVARSHTAVVTGDDAVYEGAFRQAAVVRVGDLDDLWEVGNLLAAAPGFGPGQGIALVAASGGMNSLLTDCCIEEGVALAALRPDTTDGIAALLEGRGSPGNPTDASGQLTRPSFQEILKLFEHDPAVDLIAIGLTQLASGERSRQTAGHLVQAHARASIPYVVVWASATTLDGVPTVENAGIKQVQAAGIPVFDAPAKAARALGHAQRYAARRDLVRAELTIEGDGAAREVPPHTGDHLAALGALAAAGIPVPRTEPAAGLDDALRHAGRIGYPVVLKIDAPGLLHKTEVGGVRLHLRDRDAVAAAYRDLIASTEALGEARRVLVQEQVAGGVEFLLGGLVDPVFGPVVTLGSGGTWVEIAGDVTTRVAPVAAPTADAMVGELRTARLLDGLRGAGPYDRRALVDAVVRFSRLLAGWGDAVEELEANPLVVLPEGEGVKALDVLIGPRPTVGAGR